MKPNKGFITVLMMVLISISLSTFSRAAFDTFSDVPNDSPFHESIGYKVAYGLLYDGSIVVLAKSSRAAQWRLESTWRYLEGRLKIKRKRFRSYI